MRNGQVVIDRLDALRRSLERTVEGVDREIAQRSAGADYRETYLRQIADLCRQASQLEDDVRSTLSYA